MDKTVLLFLNSISGKSEAVDTLIIFSAVFLAFWTIFLLIILLVIPNSLFLVDKGSLKSRIKTSISGFLFIIASAFVSRFIVTDIIRFLYNRPRPFELDFVYSLLSHSSGYAFPSGHASFFFAIAFSALILNKKWGALFIALAFIISISRVIAGVHWPSDILAGAGIGMIVSYVINYVNLKRSQTL